MSRLPLKQRHHITYTYKPPRLATVYKGEHHILTQLQWRKNVSWGFIEALEQYIEDNKLKAVVLEP